MAKKTKFWYVLVFSEEGPMYVTGEETHHYALWNATDKPKEFSESYAKDMAIGLTWNGHSAVPVCTAYELDNQPYRYSDYKLTWEKKEAE